MTTDDIYSVAAVCATAVGIEADRVEAARLGGRRADADVEEARAVADELVNRTRRDDRARGCRRRRHPARDRGLAHASPKPTRPEHTGTPTPTSGPTSPTGSMPSPFPIPRRSLATTRPTPGCAAEAATSGQRPQHAPRSPPPSSSEPHHWPNRCASSPSGDDSTSPSRRSRPSPYVDPLQALGISAREAEVLRLLGLGRTNRQIADELYISEKTASVHVTHLLRKLGVANRIEASAIAQRLEQTAPITRRTPTRAAGGASNTQTSPFPSAPYPATTIAQGSSFPNERDTPILSPIGSTTLEELQHPSCGVGLVVAGEVEGHIRLVGGSSDGLDVAAAGQAEPGPAVDERGVVGADVLDVVVAGDRPERRDAVPFVSVHRGLDPQQVPVSPGPPLRLVPGGGVQVDRGEPLVRLRPRLGHRQPPTTASAHRTGGPAGRRRWAGRAPRPADRRPASLRYRGWSPSARSSGRREGVARQHR